MADSQMGKGGYAEAVKFREKVLEQLTHINISLKNMETIITPPMPETDYDSTQPDFTEDDKKQMDLFYDQIEESKKEKHDHFGFFKIG